MRINLVVATLLAGTCLPLLAENPPGPPLGAGGPAPKTDQEAESKVLAVVGETEIKSQDLDRLLNRLANLNSLSEKERQEIETGLTRGLIAAALLHRLLENEKITCTDSELEAFKVETLARIARNENMKVDEFMRKRKIKPEEIEDRLKYRKFMEKAVADNKVEAFIKDNPGLFDGTKIRVSDILLPSEFVDSTQNQLEVKKNIESIAAEIKAGKKSFDQAAKDSSKGYSAKDGGDLGELVPGGGSAIGSPGAEEERHALRGGLQLQKGQSRLVRDSQGFHLVLVTQRVQGKDQPGLDAVQLARKLLRELAQDKMLDLPLADCKIEIKK